MAGSTTERDDAFRAALLEAQAETTIDGLLVVDDERNVLYYNEKMLDMWRIPESVAASRSDETLLRCVDSLLADPEEFREKVESLYAHPEEESRDTIRLTDGRWLDRYSAPVVGCDGTHYGRLWMFRDITERKEREHELESQRDELAQLQRINTLIREINQALQGKTTRKSIERAVCDRLTDSDLYQAAWIGTVGQNSAGNRAVAPQTHAGIDSSYLDGIPGGEAGPARTALETGEIQVVSDLTSADSFPDARREVALEHGHRGLAAVPLVTGETTHGVLVVYAPSEHTLDDREREVLSDFGRTIARAIQRVHSQRALAADAAVEIELAIPDADVPFADVSDRLDCELTLDRRVPASEQTGLYYFTVHGADPTQVCTLFGDVPALSDCTVVREPGDAHSGVIEVTQTDDTPLPTDVLVGHGASIRTVRATDGDMFYRVEAPMSTDVRAIVEAVGTVSPAVELVSKHVISRRVTTIPEIKDQVRDLLTPKQEAAVEVAYARGYYSWPRASTAEEVASVLDISASTLHYHLRHAHQKMLATLFEDREVTRGRQQEPTA